MVFCLAQLPRKRAVDCLGERSHNVYEVPTAHSGLGGRLIFFLRAHPSITSQAGEKRLRKSHRHLSCLGFLVCQGVQMNDGGQGEQGGEMPRRVEGSRGSWSLQTLRFPGEVVQTEESPDHLPIPHPHERRLAVGPAGSLRGRQRLYLTQARSPSLEEKGCHLTTPQPSLHGAKPLWFGLILFSCRCSG